MSGMFGGGDNASQSAQDAANQAQQQYQQYSDKAVNFNKEQNQLNRGDIENYYNKGQGYLDPYANAGKSALNDYLAGLGLGPEGSQQGVIDKFRNMPGYQFATDEGLKAANRSAAARGITQSGGLLKELTQYGQGMADQQFGKYQDRLGNLAGLGAQIAGQQANNAIGTGQNLAGLGQNMANNISGLYQGQAQNAADAALAAGQAQASGQINQQNMWGNLAGSALQGAGYLFGGPAGGVASGFLGGIFNNKKAQ